MTSLPSLAFAAVLLAALPTPQEQVAPGPVPVDVFHPDVRAGQPVPEPARGGQMIVHLASMPRQLNRVTENSSSARWIQEVTNDTLLEADPESWEWEPRLAVRYVIEDAVLLHPAAAAKYGPAVRKLGAGEEQRDALFGKATRTTNGWRLHPESKGNPLAEEVAVPDADIDSVRLGTVFTFHLREGVRWQDGHPFDAHDVLFSREVYDNPAVDCDAVRSFYTMIVDGEVVDPMTVRLFYGEQYFQALTIVGTMPILPRHLFDLTDPDHAAYDPEAPPTPAECGAYVNENPFIREGWIGTGPYRITAWTEQYIEAARWDGYWDAESPRHGGYFDQLRWRHISDDNTAFGALMSGEIDLFARMKTSDYLGAATKTEAFRKDFYAGYFYTGAWSYTCWNLHRPLFQDRNVRHALAHAFDMEAYCTQVYGGLAKQVTGSQSYFGPGYDHDVLPLAHDPGRAEELLSEAGWYDRDGDGIIDKDGIAFEFEFLFPSGNVASQTFGLMYKEALAPLGIKLHLRNFEWPTFQERVLNRDFDSFNKAWSVPFEGDPEQYWHSKWAAKELRSSNNSGLADPRVDALIEAGQREVDSARRAAIWHELHALVYDLQPYLFALNAPRKFAMNRRVRGLQLFPDSPGYSLRRLYLAAGTPGTRPIPR